MRAVTFRSWFHKVVTPLFVGALMMGSAAVFADDANNPDPFKTAKTTPDTAAATPGASSPVDVHIQFSRNDSVTLGPTGCPVIIADNNVWDVHSNTIRTALENPPGAVRRGALSANGQYYAALIPAEQNEIDVWATETGKKVSEISLGKDSAHTLLLSRNNYLIFGKSSGGLDVWDVVHNQQMDPVQASTNRIEENHVTFSPNGEYFVVALNDKITLFRTSSGKPVTFLSPPKYIERPDIHHAAAGAGGGTDQKPARAERPRTGGSPGEMNFFNAWLKSIAFSPDGKEIAAYGTYPVPRVVVWDLSGRIVFDETISVADSIFIDMAIQWFPDKTGWLIGGTVVSRVNKRSVVKIDIPMTGPRPWLYDPNHVVAALNSDPGELKSYEIPWKDINESLTMLSHPKDALLSPSHPVSVKVDVGNVGGDAATVANQIAEAFTQRLHRDGIPVEDNSDTVYTLKLSENPGDTLPIYERQSPFDFRGKDTGRTMTEQKGVLVVELTTKGDGKVLWRDTVSADSGRSFQEEINDATIRKSMLESLTMRMNQMNPPYFIPKDEKKLALPVMMQ